MNGKQGENKRIKYKNKSQIDIQTNTQKIYTILRCVYILLILKM